MLRFWCSKLHFGRKSRTKASFLSFKASFLKEVSHKSFVFELQSFIFEGSLAQKLRFWASKLHFWRKSRTKASFLILKASILKEVSHKSFVFDLEILVFEGSLAQKLRVWASKLHFWRKSRRKASFLSIKVSILKDVSQKSCVFNLQSSFLEWSFARKFIFEIQGFVFETSLADMLRFSRYASQNKSSKTGRPGLEVMRGGHTEVVARPSVLLTIAQPELKTCQPRCNS